MQSLSRFQIVLLAIFSFFIIAGVVVFATRQSTSTGENPPIAIWGVVPENIMQRVFEDPTFKSNNLRITYFYKDANQLDQDLVEALAEGRGPDLVIMPQSLLHKEKSRIVPISYKVISARDFKNSYIEAAESLMGEEGIWGIPLTVDPMVLYWNRTSFTNAGIAEPPKTWDELVSIVPKLAKKDSVGNLKSFAIALGEYSNVSHAKEILSTLIIQNGNPISMFDNFGELVVQIYGDGAKSRDALAFYTSFVDPVRANYTWSRSQRNSTLAFSESSLSMYLGFGSELTKIAGRNPNLNFDIAPIPQIKDSARVTFGSLTLMAIPKQSANPQVALLAAQVLGSREILQLMTNLTDLPPVRRDLLSSSPENAYQKVLYDSALIAKTWEDPDSDLSSQVFKELIETVTSGKSSITEALSVANSELQNLVKDNQ